MSITRMLIFLTVVLGITGLVHYYFWARLVRSPQLPAPWGTIVTGVIILLACTIPASFLLFRSIPWEISRYLMFGPYVWMGMMLMFLALLAVFDAGFLTYRGIRYVSGGGPLAAGARLHFYRMEAMIVVVAVVLQAAVALALATRGPVVREIPVTLSKLPRSLDGYTIVQITDLHIGSTLDRKWSEKVVEEALRVKGDLIVLTGDLMDGSPGNLRRQVAPFGRLSARDGVYFVTGNHEYYSNVLAWLPEIRALGMRVLRNERVTIERNGAAFDLAGVDDYTAKGMAPGHGQDIPRALEGRDKSREVVLLAHQPRATQEASQHDVGLVLSGHTHGGQIWPWHYMVFLQQPYRSGLHQHEDTRTQVYVSDGTGFWGPPMRLGTRNEITVIRLRSPATGPQ